MPSALLDQLGRDAQIGHRDAPHGVSCGRENVSHLGCPKGHREVGFDVGPRDIPPTAAQSTRQIDGQTRESQSIERLDQLGVLPLQRAGQSYTKEGIDHQIELSRRLDRVVQAVFRTDLPNG